LKRIEEQLATVVDLDPLAQQAFFQASAAQTQETEEIAAR